MLPPFKQLIDEYLQSVKLVTGNKTHSSAISIPKLVLSIEVKRYDYDNNLCKLAMIIAMYIKDKMGDIPNDIKPILEKNKIDYGKNFVSYTQHEKTHYIVIK